MANTRQSAKRSRQEDSRKSRNTLVRGVTRSALKQALEALRTKDVAKAKAAYQLAVKALSKAASKGVMPKRRAARKVSRLTLLAKKVMPESIKA